MNREKTRHLRAAKLTAVFCAALVLGWSLPGQAVSPARHVDKVLVLYHEAGFAAPANRMIFTSMLKYFQEHEDRDVVLYSETLDLTLFPGKNGRRALIDFYRLKYAREHIDVVVPVQGPALDFLLENRASLFPKVPIVYLAPAEVPPQPGKDDITGVAFAIDLRGTIDIARNAQPGLKRVAVVAGAGETDLRLADLARKTLQADFKGLETIDLAGLPMDELLGRVSALPKSTAILFLPFYRDGAGRRFVPVEALKLVSSSANAPVYSTSDSHLGQGCVGGRMINYEFLGARAAWMALRIMNGEKPGDIRPEVIGNAAPLFDWRQLKRWHIPEKNLPPGSNVRYRTLTFWEKDRRYIMGMAAFSVAQLVLIAFLLLSIRTRKRVEKELRESEVRYRTVADFTYDWEYWIDPRGVFRYNSPSCERVTGYTPDDFARDPGLRRKLIIPEDQEKWERHLHEETKMLVLRSAQFRIRRKDGEVRWIDHTCVPVKDASGTFSGYRASNRDITERKLAEEDLGRSRRALEEEIDRRRTAQEALAESEADLKRAQDVAAIGSWKLDIPGDVLTWSDAVYDIFGMPRDEDLHYGSFLEAVHPDDRDLVKRSWRLALGGVPYDIEHRILVDGAVKWVREKAEVDFSPDGSPLTGTGIVQDITRRKAAENEQHKLRQSLAQVSQLSTAGELTTTLAHEINQPLAAILANAQAARHMIDEPRPDLAELRETLDDIISDDKRAREVVQRVRGIMKKDGGAFERMEIAGLIQETVRLVEKEAFIRNVGIRMESDPSLPQVVVDRIQIQQVLINLLFNAMEAMADGGPDRGITVRSAMNDEGRVVVAVEDTGKGIAPEEAAQLFEPFYTTKQGGLGLGLSISRSIVEAHGGKLFVRPNPRGGAVFSFTLQAAQGSAR